MSNLFQFNEIIKFAVEREQESVELYQHLAKNTSEKTTKALFEQLVKEERKHETFYENLMSETQKSLGSKALDTEEYDAYMREMISANRTIPPLTAIDFSNAKLAINYAMDREKDAILFYTGLKNYVPASLKENIEGIIREEAGHVAILADIEKHI